MITLTFLCVLLWIYIYRERDRQTDRHPWFTFISVSEATFRISSLKVEILVAEEKEITHSDILSLFFSFGGAGFLRFLGV